MKQRLKVKSCIQFRYVNLLILNKLPTPYTETVEFQL